MLYIFHGSDTEKARDKVHAFLEALFKKRPDARLFRVDADTFDPEEVKRLTQEQGLFDAKHVVFLDRVGENPEHTTALEECIADIAASPQMFVVLEGALTKKAAKPFQVYAEEVFTFDKTEKKKKEEVDVFAFTDAFGARNKGKAWTLYQQALSAGKTPEEMHGLLHWYVRSMTLSAEAHSAKAAGLNPFVYKKSRAAADRFSKDELQGISKDLVSIYHHSRMGEGELEENLELFLLRRV